MRPMPTGAEPERRPCLLIVLQLLADLVTEDVAFGPELLAGRIVATQFQYGSQFLRQRQVTRSQSLCCSVRQMQLVQIPANLLELNAEQLAYPTAGFQGGEHFIDASIDVRLHLLEAQLKGRRHGGSFDSFGQEPQERRQAELCLTLDAVSG